MASIFDVQPPAWLQEIAKPIDTRLTGQAIGMALGAGTKALERDPNAPADAGYFASRKGIKQGLFEERMSQTDPMWRLKAEGMKSQLMTSMADAQMKAAQLKEYNDELAKWMKASPGVAKWMSYRPEERLTEPAPDTFGSMRAAEIQESVRTNDARILYQKEMINLRRDNAQTQLLNQKRMMAFEDSAAKIPPLYQSRIAALPGNGWIQDARGNPLRPSPDAIAILDEGLKEIGEPSFGTPPTVEAARVRAKSAEALQEKKQEGAVQLVEKRLEAQMKLETMKAANAMQRVQIQAELKRTADQYAHVRVITKQKFINDNWKKMADIIMKNTTITNPATIANDAKAMLDFQYDTIPQPPEPKPITPTTPTAPAAKPLDRLNLY